MDTVAVIRGWECEIEKIVLLKEQWLEPDGPRRLLPGQHTP
jgi:hypothetical protein